MINKNATFNEKSFIPTILVPIDATEQTAIALDQSCNLARFTKSKIVLLGVNDGTTYSAQKKLAELAVEIC